MEWPVLETWCVWRIDQGIVCLGFWRDSPRADLRFDEPSICSAYAVLLHMCHFVEWHVLETWCRALVYLSLVEWHILEM